MKRIGTLVVAGLIASSTMLAAQDLGVGFERAVTAAEREADGVAVRAQLVEVIGESIYIVTTSSGERVLVSAETGSVEEVQDPLESPVGGRGRGGSRGLGGMETFGALLEAADAEIDFDQLIATASGESGREDVHSIAIRQDGGVVVAHVAFGTMDRFASPNDNTESPVAVVIDVEKNEALGVVEPAESVMPRIAGRVEGFAGTRGPQPESRLRGPGSSDPRGGHPGGGFSGGGRR